MKNSYAFSVLLLSVVFSEMSGMKKFDGLLGQYVQRQEMLDESFFLHFSADDFHTIPEEDESLDIGGPDDEIVEVLVVQESPVEKRKTTDESVQFNKKMKIKLEVAEVADDFIEHFWQQNKQGKLGSIITNNAPVCLTPKQHIQSLSVIIE